MRAGRRACDETHARVARLGDIIDDALETGAVAEEEAR
jgi:hypothetical protein